MQRFLQFGLCRSPTSVFSDFRRNVRNFRGLYEVSKQDSPESKQEEDLAQFGRLKADKPLPVIDHNEEDQIAELTIQDPIDLELLQDPQNELDPIRRKYIEQRNTRIVQVMQDYRDRHQQMTEWRQKHEEFRSRRKLALPFSLTGFGDCSRLTRFWTQRIQGQLKRIADKERLKSDFIEALSPVLVHLFEKGAEHIPDKYKSIYERYLSEKKRLEEQQLQLIDTNNNRPIQLPFDFADSIRKEHPVAEYEKEDALIKDEDYDNYLKHHHLLEFISDKFDKVAGFQYEAEIEALTNSMWQRDYGHPDPKVAPSNVPCGGCGANLHCTDTSIPGYLPSEKFVELTKNQLKETICQRCDFLRLFNVSLNVTVKEEEYEQIIGELKNRRGLIILLVDLIDFPGSVNPRIFELIGASRKIYVVGNKVDLLPCDGDGYLKRIKQSLIENLKFQNHVPLTNVMLISAKTGYGVEDMITRLFQDWNGKGDIYLVGCTNVGKSTLFNTLLQSDLCNLRQNDIIQRATTSLWPGTTLNLLKFPLRRIEGWQLELRRNRLNYMQLREHKNEKALRTMNKFQETNDRISVMENRISSTFRKETPYKFESGHPLAHKLKAPRPFDAEHPAFKNSHFFHDTPGTIYRNQILSLLTTEELLKTIPRKQIEPRTFSFHPGQTLFLAGLGRLDLVSCRRNLLVTVFASNYLPVHICFTDQADHFYKCYLGTDLMAVPMGDSQRLSQWPELVSRDFYLNNSTELYDYCKNSSCADVVFSTAGWASITIQPDDECLLRAYTPEGRGLFLRAPSLLPYAVRLRGKKIKNTPCFEKHRPYVHTLGEDNYSLRLLSKNHFENPQLKDQLQLAPEIEPYYFPKLTAGT